MSNSDTSDTYETYVAEISPAFDNVAHEISRVAKSNDMQAEYLMGLVMSGCLGFMKGAAEHYAPDTYKNMPFSEYVQKAADVLIRAARNQEAVASAEEPGRFGVLADGGSSVN